MSIGIFVEKAHQPSVNELRNALGSRYPLWQMLVTFLQENYALTGEWNFGGIKYGWNLFYRKGGKTLVTLYPQAKSFITQIVLGREQTEHALALRLGKNVGTVLCETPQLHDGRWLFIKTKTAKDIKDIQQLLQVKRRPRPQKTIGGKESVQ